MESEIKCDKVSINLNDPARDDLFIEAKIGKQNKNKKSEKKHKEKNGCKLMVFKGVIVPTTG